MKKIFVILLITVCICSLAACSNNVNSDKVQAHFIGHTIGLYVGQGVSEVIDADSVDPSGNVRESHAGMAGYLVGTCVGTFVSESVNNGNA